VTERLHTEVGVVPAGPDGLRELSSVTLKALEQALGDTGDMDERLEALGDAS
jgi:hypothetical protein